LNQGDDKKNNYDLLKVSFFGEEDTHNLIRRLLKRKYKKDENDAFEYMSIINNFINY
jgi:hypothetical protein